MLTLSDCSFGDQSSQLLFVLRELIFSLIGLGLLSNLGLTVQPRPPALTGQLSDLGWTVDHGWTPLQISENENSPTTKKLRYRALSTSEQAVRGSTEHLFSVSDVIPHDRNWIPILLREPFQLQPRHFQCSPGAFPPQPRSICTAAQEPGI